MEKSLLNNLKGSKKINFQEVLKTFLKEHDPKVHHWPLHLLEQANKQVGSWIKAKLPMSVIYEVMLPVHYHKKKGVYLIPQRGMIAKDVYHRLKNLPNYKDTNPECYSTINYFKKGEIGTIFLSSVTPAGRDSYSNNEVRSHLLHIDGLHRILALIGRKENKLVDCIIAVKPSRLDSIIKG